MKTLTRSLGWASFIGCTLASTLLSLAASLETAPPVVVKTSPIAGAQEVDPQLAEITVTFSKTMTDGSWSWSTWSDDSFPETQGKPRYLADQRTCVLPVKLLPNHFYALWLNSEKFRNFKDTQQTPAVPYLLTFRTADAKASAGPSAPANSPVPAGPLNADQQTVLDWTDRQFRGFFDGRSFDGWSEKERADLESRLVDTLKGPISREYYQSINSLAALHATNALPALRVIALERRDKDNRDRWMAIRALGMIGDRASVPELIHLVYHGNSNTRWWAQISLVRITGKNFGTDWKAWCAWWNEQSGEPRCSSEIIRWWNGQAEPDKLASSLAEADEKFLSGIRR
jgi:hypothetical protein